MKQQSPRGTRGIAERQAKRRVRTGKTSSLGPPPWQCSREDPSEHREDGAAKQQSRSRAQSERAPFHRMPPVFSCLIATAG
jgi:hypothetical protein